jgi:hypothetical protein
MFQAVSIRNIATDHVGIIYHAPATSNYVLARVAASGCDAVPGFTERHSVRPDGVTLERAGCDAIARHLAASSMGR